MTIHGKDMGGHRVAPVTRLRQRLVRQFRRSGGTGTDTDTHADRQELGGTGNEKNLFLLIMVGLVLGVSSCKRTEIDDPPWDGPAGFNILVEGSVSPPCC